VFKKKIDKFMEDEINYLYKVKDYNIKFIAEKFNISISSVSRTINKVIYYCTNKCGSVVCSDNRKCRTCSSLLRFQNEENHPRWKGGLPNCIGYNDNNCLNKVKDYKSKRCKSCSSKQNCTGKIISGQALINIYNSRLRGKDHPFYGSHRSMDTKNKISLKNSGKNNGNYINGSTPLNKSIRKSLNSKEWRTTCFKRDNYICQECGQVGGKLNVDHIKPFSVILREFLDKYNQFSPIEDKETLLRLAMEYKPFWNIQNGQTLCTKCHTEKTKKDYEVNKYDKKNK